MKTFRKVMALVLATSMMSLLFVGCGGKDGTESSKPADTGVSPERESAIAAEPAEISFLIAGFDGTDEKSPYYKAIKELETKYNKKVTVMTTTGQQTWNEKVAAQVAAKDPIDVFCVKIEQYLSMYQKGYLGPVDKYVDLSKEWHNTKVMDKYIRFDGKYYAGCVSATPYVLYYNRDVLANNGFDPDEPQKLYEKGEWTWDKFVEIARECSDDEGGIMGLENMFDEVFQASNACAAVNYKDGKYELNIMSPEMRNTLEMVQDVFHTNPICGVGYVTGQNKFLKGKAAFHGAYAYEDTTFTALKEKGTVNINYGVTAFPVGPDNKEKVNFGYSTGFAIASGSEAPYTAGMLIDLIGKHSTEQSKQDAEKVPAERQAFYDKLAENLFVPSYTDGILDKGFGAFYMLYYVRQGDDINSVRSTYQTNYQKMIDDANALIKK